MTPFAGNKM